MGFGESGEETTDTPLRTRTGIFYNISTETTKGRSFILMKTKEAQAPVVVRGGKRYEAHR
jgi:hypothetical protein